MIFKRKNKDANETADLSLYHSRLFIAFILGKLK